MLDSLILCEEWSKLRMIVVESSGIERPARLKIAIIFRVREKCLFRQCDRRGVVARRRLQHFFRTEQGTKKGMIMVEPSRIEVATKGDFVEKKGCRRGLVRVHWPRRDRGWDVDLESLSGRLRGIDVSFLMSIYVIFGMDQSIPAAFLEKSCLLEILLPTSRMSRRSVHW